VSWILIVKPIKPMSLLRIAKAWGFKQKMKIAFNACKELDRTYLRALPRWKRKQFWNDFVNRENFRNVTFANIPGLEWMRKRLSR